MDHIDNLTFRPRAMSILTTCVTFHAITQHAHGYIIPVGTHYHIHYIIYNLRDISCYHQTCTWLQNPCGDSSPLTLPGLTGYRVSLQVRVLTLSVTPIQGNISSLIHFSSTLLGTFNLCYIFPHYQQ